MELKSYQSSVLNDLSRFMDIIQKTQDISVAYNRFWKEHDRTPLTPQLGKTIEPYLNNIPNCPHVCMKVPTAGGKTFIASAALKVIFNHFNNDMKRAVVWLVPSDAILAQTLKNLKDINHPYRQRINVDFSGKVEVYSKSELLNGTGLSVESLDNNLNIFVLGYDSIRSNNKEGRKVYQDNGHLQSLYPLTGGLSTEDTISAMEILNKLNPVVIVDESHNAKSDLSIDMLKSLNPSFILDLTATPTKQSNIISIVPAIELKKANMVKLPVIVVNQKNEKDVIRRAIDLQRNLEDKAMRAYRNGEDKYIRPIVLFQAQPKQNNDNVTFDKLKEVLLKIGISEEQVKIKTANVNEIKNTNLMAEDCPVRFIITMNALKEGWDCPFAYILASITNRSSVTDVTQILGRVLRLPYTHKHSVPELNLSYVLTSSKNFQDTMGEIVKGLNNSGFSDPDERLAVGVNNLPQPEKKDYQPIFPELEEKEDIIDELLDFDEWQEEQACPDTNTNMREEPSSYEKGSETSFDTSVNDIIDRARNEHDRMDNDIKEIERSENDGMSYVPTEMNNSIITTNIKDIFADSIKNLFIPQFSMNFSVIGMFGDWKDNKLFDSRLLLSDFKLEKADTNINFAMQNNSMYKIDIEKSGNGYTPTYAKVDKRERNSILNLMQNAQSQGQRESVLHSALIEEIGCIPFISDLDLGAYLRRVIASLTLPEFDEVTENLYSAANAIKEKIKQLMNSYLKENFIREVETGEIESYSQWKFPMNKTLKEIGPAITKSLYEKEEGFNDFEREVINEVANLDNVEWWTRNRERKDFYINGFINHYPDFIIKTKKGKIILLETKGDHLDAENKIELGNLWAKTAGPDYRYYLVYNKREVKGSYTLDNFMRIMEKL